jgi:hypothetical protein
MRFRCLIAAAATLVAGGFVTAQPNDAGPTIELRLRSVNDLVDRAGYVAGLAGMEDAVKQVRQLLKAMTTDGKGVEGVDPTKPIGVYATLEKDAGASPLVILIPVADQTQFLAALKRHLGVEPEKDADGALKLNVPFINELALRFANGYLYLSPKAKNLDAKALVKPAAYFATDDGAVLSLLVHIDRIPADLKTFALGQIELNVSQARKKDADKETEVERRFKDLILDAGLSGFKGLTEDGKDLSVRLFADAKTDGLAAEVALRAKSGSPVARQFAALGKKTSLPAGIVDAANPVARSSARVALPEDLKKDYTAAVEAALAELVKKAPPEHEEVVKQIVAALSPTLKAGELDKATELVGPDSKGHYRLLGASAVKKGKGIEKLLKGLVDQFGAAVEGFVGFKFDVETVGDFTLHRIELKQPDDAFEKVFGTGVIWLATSDDCLAYSVEPEGETIRKGLKAKPVAAPVLTVDVSMAKLVPLVRPDLNPEDLKALMKQVFGDGPTAGKDTIHIGIEGTADTLTATFKLQGKALRGFAGLVVPKKQ